MTFHYTRAAFVCVLVFLVSACEQKTADDAKALVTVNGEKITEDDFQYYLKLRHAQQEPMADKEQEKKIVLGEMIDRVLLTQQAVKDKLEQDPEISHLIKHVHQNIMVQSMVRKTLKDNPISDETLKARFEQEVKDTHKVEYMVRHILVKNEDEAKEILTNLKNKANFATLAKKESIDVQTGKKGGQIGWVNQGAVPAEFFEAVTRLQKGAISSEPVKSEFGWHIIKVEDTRPVHIPSFEEFIENKQTRANFYRKLQDEKIEQLAKDLRAQAKIVEH